MILLVLAAALPALPHAEIELVVRHLDMTSFPNSLGPRPEPSGTNLQSFPNMSLGWLSDGLLVSEFDPVEKRVGWERSFRLLGTQSGAMRFCFTDKAIFGTYHVRSAIEVLPGTYALRKARIVIDPRCPAFAR
jgi:hypothetical protein